MPLICSLSLSLFLCVSPPLFRFSCLRNPNGKYQFPSLTLAAFRLCLCLSARPMCFPITLDYAAEIVITLRCDLHFKSRRESFESVSYTLRLRPFALFAFVNCNFSIDMPRDSDENSQNISNSFTLSLSLSSSVWPIKFAALRLI